VSARQWWLAEAWGYEQRRRSSRLSPAFREDLLRISTERGPGLGRALDVGETLCKGGDPNHRWYIVSRGTLEVLPSASPSAGGVSLSSTGSAPAQPTGGQGEGADGGEPAASLASVRLLQARDHFGQGCVDGTELRRRSNVRAVTITHVFEVDVKTFCEAFLRHVQEPPPKSPQTPLHDAAGRPAPHWWALAARAARSLRQTAAEDEVFI